MILCSLFGNSLVMVEVAVTWLKNLILFIRLTAHRNKLENHSAWDILACVYLFQSCSAVGAGIRCQTALLV